MKACQDAHFSAANGKWKMETGEIGLRVREETPRGLSMGNLTDLTEISQRGQQCPNLVGTAGSNDTLHAVCDT